MQTITGQLGITKDVTINLNPYLNIFVGANDCGKSFFLEQIEDAILIDYYPVSHEDFFTAFYPERMPIGYDFVDAIKAIYNDNSFFGIFLEYVKSFDKRIILS